MELIDRKALLERMNEFAAFAVTIKLYMSKDDIAENVLKQAKETALRLVEEAPTIEADPVVHGEWVQNDIGIYFCSVCDSEAYWDTDYGQQLFPCCPYCGTPMDGKAV